MECRGIGMVICLEHVADLHMAQLMPLPLTVSCFSKIQTGFTFLVLAHLNSLGKRAVKWVCMCVWATYEMTSCEHCSCRQTFHLNSVKFIRLAHHYLTPCATAHDIITFCLPADSCITLCKIPVFFCVNANVYPLPNYVHTVEAKSCL